MNRDVCEHFNPVDLPCGKCKSANVQKSTLREAAQQALEALEYAEANHGGDDCYADSITALRAALAEPEGPCPTCVSLARAVMMDQMGSA